MATLPFRCLVRVRYADIDAQKIVFNARWGDYVDVAVTEFQRVAIGAVDGPDAIDMRLVKQTLTWKGSAMFDDILEARVATRAIGTTSFTIGCEFRRWPDGPLLLESETIYVAMAGDAKTPVAPAHRAALERGAPGVIVDLAGAAGPQAAIVARAGDAAGPGAEVRP